MEPESSFGPLVTSIGVGLDTDVQGELFPVEAIRRSARPTRIDVRNPNHPNHTRVIVAASWPMRELLSVVERVAPTAASVLILGESGTGKNLLAWLLHNLSSRAGRPFVHFAAGQKTENLMESELFGHERGAFTGAHTCRRGKIELAHGGTLFIDEVGDLGDCGQLKFHRLLDEGVYERLGGTELHRSDVRVIAATHRDLWARVREGRFREDLYHRLNVVTLRVPPLRERPADIPSIAQETLEEFRTRYGRANLAWSPETLAFLEKLPWQGNVRSLRNVVERMVILSKADVLRLAELPFEVFFGTSTTNAPSPPARSPRAKPSDEAGRRRFEEAYCACQGNKSALARLLSTSRSQIDRLIERYGKPE